MITRISVEGFRILRQFVWEPGPGVNVLVGTNSAGKSTVLDAIELVLRGGIGGSRASSALAPDWFNVEITSEFFEKLIRGENANIPEINITVTFADEPEMAPIRGCYGPDGAAADLPGLTLTISVPQNLRTEFLTESSAIAMSSEYRSIPVEYFECIWSSFKGDRIFKRPACITCARVDAQPAPYSRAVDSYAREMVESELAEEDLRDISRKIREAHSKIDSEILSKVEVRNFGRIKKLGLQLDKSPRSDWKNTIVLARDGLPFSALGSADQILTRCAISLEKSTSESVLLMEEPECHLSHTALRSLLDLIEGRRDDAQQVFVTTHSPFVLNRLGLDGMSIIASGGNPARIGDLAPGTVNYFKRLSGFDTLRVVLADKAVLVEGPTDEMVFEWAFTKTRGHAPQACGIDIIECGIQYKRIFELASAVGKTPVIALRDNDDKDEDHWISAASCFTSAGIKLFVGHNGAGRTLELQMVEANSDKLAQLAKAVGITEASKTEIEKYLLGHKTKWSLDLLEADPNATKELEVPDYITEAIDFVDPIAEKASR